MRVLLLHGYSAANQGDGLLVEESLRSIADAFGDDAEISVLASHPETFQHLGVTVIDSGLHSHGYDLGYLRTLFSLGKSFDVLVAVGGGYLRFGTPMETVKTLLIHGPQLVAVAFSSIPSIYMPQSVGPLRFGTKRIATWLLRNTSFVALRDDRSVQELAGNHNIRRVPDMALISGKAISSSSNDPLARPVLSVRSIRGELPIGVLELAERIKDFDVYVQSRTSGNDDTFATSLLGDRHEIGSTELLSGEPTRVIVAVRLHAALMAMRAGHYVIHLSYERKGFGAFDDLGLTDYVHNVHKFDLQTVLDQIQSLTYDANKRELYAKRVKESEVSRHEAYQNLISDMKASIPE